MSALHSIPLPKIKLTGVAMNGHDFTGQDLSKQNLSRSKFINCCFDDANLTSADCSQSDFTGSTFRRTDCYYANFGNSILASTVFEPRDAYGMTITMNCQTFSNCRMSQMWWFAWLMFATNVKPADGPVKGDLIGLLIQMIGNERYLSLKQLLSRRKI